jgi:hypothetical protein
MSNIQDKSDSVIFPKGVKVPNDHFIGAAYLEILVPHDNILNCPVGNVTFEEIIGTSIPVVKFFSLPMGKDIFRKKANPYKSFTKVTS